MNISFRVRSVSQLKGNHKGLLEGNHKGLLEGNHNGLLEGNHKGLPLRINDRRGNPLWLPPIRYGYPGRLFFASCLNQIGKHYNKLK